jgi:hypothetical protein
MREAIDLARSSGDARLLGDVFCSFSLTAYHPGNASERLEVTAELLGLSAKLGLPAFELMARDARCVALLELADLPGAWAEADTLERLVGRRDSILGANVLSRTAARQFLEGDLSAAEATTLELLTVATDRISTFYFAGHLLDIRFNQNRSDELLPGIEQAASTQPRVLVYQAVLARTLARSGREERAREILHRLTTSSARIVPEDVAWYPAMVCFADAAEVTHDTESASTLEQLLAPYTGRLAMGWTTMSLPVDIARSQLALATGREDVALELATSALRLARAIGAPIFTARALILQATCLDRDGQPTADIIREAFALADQTGAALVYHEAIRYGLT